MTIHDWMELVSLGGTLPTVACALAVVLMFMPVAYDGVCATNKTREEWLVLGTVVGFIGGAIDNMYWTIPWTLDYIDHPGSIAYWRAGVYWNVFARQGAGIIAAYCHLRGAAAPQEAAATVRCNVHMLNIFFIVVNVLGVLCSVLLYTLKPTG